MAKGFFMQGLAVLFREAPSVSALRELLEPEFPGGAEKPGSERWELGGPSVVLPYGGGTNGAVIVDAVPHSWPDHMGHPQTDPILFGAWTLGHFAPLAFPSGLQRAVQQARRWAGASEAVAQHRAFVRVRLSYVLGVGKDAKVRPPESDSLEELRFVTSVAMRVAAHSDALCVFNPGGEVVLDRERLQEQLDFALQHQRPALDAWTNIRLFREADWVLMDTVGNGQFDLPDLEAAFPLDAFDPRHVHEFLRNTTLYLLEHGEVVKDGNTLDGPGGVHWRAHHGDGLSSPPRPVLRCLPTTVNEVPKKFRAPPPPPAEKPKGLLRRWLS